MKEDRLVFIGTHCIFAYKKVCNFSMQILHKYQHNKEKLKKTDTQTEHFGTNQRIVHRQGPIHLCASHFRPCFTGERSS